MPAYLDRTHTHTNNHSKKKQHKMELESRMYLGSSGETLFCLSQTLQHSFHTLLPLSPLNRLLPLSVLLLLILLPLLSLVPLPALLPFQHCQELLCSCHLNKALPQRQQRLSGREVGMRAHGWTECHLNKALPQRQQRLSGRE
ncbi:unnamed protein product, partial [Closterium sp. NIES-53]